MKSPILLTFSLLLLSSLFNASTYAQDSEVTEKMCAKVKTCAVEQMGADVPPEMIQMMEGMFDGMCASMLAEQYAEIDNAGLEDEANACAESFIATSCDEIMANEGEFSTPACDEFKEAADAAGIDTGS